MAEIDVQDKDIEALRAALQRQEALAADIAAHDERVGAAAALGDELVAQNYNAAKVILCASARFRRPIASFLTRTPVRGVGRSDGTQAGERAKALRRRHADVDKRLRDVRLRLSNDLLAASFSHDADAAESFIAAKMPLAMSSVDETDLATADEQQQLQNELELDVIGQEDKIALVAAVAHSVEGAKHPTAKAMLDRSDGIDEDWSALKAAVTARGVAVSNLLRGARASGALKQEAEWIKERLVEAESTDYGKDLPTTEQHLKAHAALGVAMGMHEEPIQVAVRDARNSSQVRRRAWRAPV